MKLPHIPKDKTHQHNAHIDLDFHRQLSRMKKKSHQANHLQSYLNKKSQTPQAVPLLSQENKSLDCLVRKKKQMCAQSYVEMQKIVEGKYNKVLLPRETSPDLIGDNRYSVSQQFQSMRKMMDRLSYKDYLRKKDRNQMDVVGDCDSVMQQTKAKMELIIEKDQRMKRIQQQDQQRSDKERMAFQRQMDIIQRKQDRNNKVRIRRRRSTKTIVTHSALGTTEDQVLSFHDLVQRQENNLPKDTRDQIMELQEEARRYQQFYKRYFNVDSEQDMVALLEDTTKRRQLHHNFRRYVSNSQAIDFSEYSQFLVRRKYFLDMNKYQQLQKTQASHEEPVYLNLTQQEHQQYVQGVKNRLKQFYDFLCEMKGIIQQQQTHSSSRSREQSSEQQDTDSQTCQFQKGIRFISEQCKTLKQNKTVLNDMAGMTLKYRQMARSMNEQSEEQKLWQLKRQMET